MSKVIDITSKLTNDRPTIKLSEDMEFEVDNRKNTVLKVEKMLSGEDVNSIAVIDQVLAEFIGKDAVEKIDKLDLSFGAYKTIFTGVMAGAMGEDFEVVKERFQ